MLVLMTQASFGLGMILSTAILDPATVNRVPRPYLRRLLILQVQPLFTLPLVVLAGFFVNLDSLGPWISWVQYLSYVKYAYRYALRAALTGSVFNCSYSEWKEVPRIPVPKWANDTTIGRIANVTDQAYLCPVSTGDAYLERMGISVDNYALDIIWVVLFIVGFHTISCFLLYIRKPKLQ